MGSKDKAIKKAMAEKGKKKVAEHHQKDAAGNTIPHEEEGDGTPSSVEEANKNLQIFLKNEGFSIDFESCVNNKNIEDFVLNDRIEGAKNFKISSTPTIIINNEKFEKKLNYKNLKKALEKMI